MRVPLRSAIRRPVATGSAASGVEPSRHPASTAAMKIGLPAGMEVAPGLTASQRRFAADVRLTIAAEALTQWHLRLTRASRTAAAAGVTNQVSLPKTPTELATASLIPSGRPLSQERAVQRTS